jgi:putative membrane protein
MTSPPPTGLTPYLTAWSWPLVPLVSLTVSLAIYLRGWRLARRTRPEELPAWRAWCFTAGIVSLWIALASPIDALDDALLAAHMLQHFILMSVAPPLLVLGAPLVPMLRGLPRPFVRRVLGPLLRSRMVRRTVHALFAPALVWAAMNTAYLGWHVPRVFEAALHSENIHQLEHACFFFTSLAFWWIVIEPWPSRPRWPRWAMIPYLLSADILNTVLSALLCFSGRVFYPSYAAAARITSLSPLQDQVAAGAEMWVLNSTVFLIPAIAITIAQLSPATSRHRALARETSAPLASSIAAKAAPRDILR